MNETFVLESCMLFQHHFKVRPTIVFGKLTYLDIREQEVKNRIKETEKYMIPLSQIMAEREKIDGNILSMFGYFVEVGDFDVGFILK